MSETEALEDVEQAALDKIMAEPSLVVKGNTPAAKAKKKTTREEAVESQITVNKSLPIPKAKEPPVYERQSFFQIAARAICTCGEVMARPRTIPNGEWSCMRILTGNKPTKWCQVVPSHKILAELPPPVVEAEED